MPTLTVAIGRDRRYFISSCQIFLTSFSGSQEKCLGVGVCDVLYLEELTWGFVIRFGLFGIPSTVRYNLRLMNHSPFGQ